MARGTNRTQRMVTMAVFYKYSTSALLVGGLLIGCYAGVGAGSTGTAVVTPDGGGGGVTNLPCDVQAVLAASCDSCHSATPANGVPMSLMTYDDLVAPSKSDPSKTNAQLSVERMQATKNPMPPQGGASAADIQTLQNWIASGAIKGSCGSEVEAGPDPYATDPICTANKNTNVNEGAAMLPGQDCLDSQCHGDTTWNKAMAFAGTVYPTAHEPDNCVGSTAALTVTVTDENGKQATAKVIPPSGKNLGSAGNFYFWLYNNSGVKQLEPGPMSSIVVTGPNGTRAMSETAPSGACNACHTQKGDNPFASQGFKSVAPGRIMAP
jgi:hypothetical protein